MTPEPNLTSFIKESVIYLQYLPDLSPKQHSTTKTRGNEGKVRVEESFQACPHPLFFFFLNQACSKTKGRPFGPSHSHSCPVVQNSWRWIRRLQHQCSLWGRTLVLGLSRWSRAPFWTFPSIRTPMMHQSPGLET